jgi:hypothetical protein
MQKVQANVFRKLVMAIPLVLLLLVSTAIIQPLNAQNSTISGAGGSSGKTTVTAAGNKTIIMISPGRNTTPGAAPAASSSSSATTSGANYNRTGFNNLYVLTSNGKTFPVKYTITGGKLVGMLADKDRSTLVLVLNPSPNGGNFTTELPRNLIDSKGASSADTKYLIKIDGKGVDYKEIANNLNARILSIDFSKDNRFVEIIGTQMTS